MGFKSSGRGRYLKLGRLFSLAFRVVVVPIKKTSEESLKFTPGNPNLTLEMLDDAGKVINVQSIKRRAAIDF